MGELPLFSEVYTGVFRLARRHPGVGTVNAYLLAGSPSLLVDTACLPNEKWEVHAGLMNDFLSFAGVSGSSVAGVVLTHFHRDHSGGASWLASHLGVPVLTGPKDIRLVLHDWTPPSAADENSQRDWLLHAGAPAVSIPQMIAGLPQRPAELFCGVPLLVPLRDNATVSTGRSTWRVLHTPGHSPGHLCLINDEDRIILTGDMVLPPGGGNASVGYRDTTQAADPLADYLTSLERLKNLKVSLVLPGHGPAHISLAQLCIRHVLHHDRRLGLVERLLSRRPGSAYTIARRTVGAARFNALPPTHQVVAIAEALARLRHLATKGRVRARDGRVHMWAVEPNVRHC